MVKSAIAVMLCLWIDSLRPGGIPFYSAIAAVLCMQPYVSNSLKVALNRTVGTLIGGFAGMLILALEQALFPPQMVMARDTLVAVMIVPLIYITVALHKTSASYITCVVFLSITVAHGADTNPYAFALNRMIDTFVGIFISLGVNLFRLPHHKNRDILFCLCPDGMALDGGLSGFARVKLNHLMARGAQITAATAGPPACQRKVLAELSFPMPVIVMNGAALYHVRDDAWTDLITIPREVVDGIGGLADETNLFVHAVWYEALHIYCGGFTHPAQEDYFHAMRKLPHQTVAHCEVPPDAAALYLLAIDAPDRIKRLRAAVERSEWGGSVRMYAGGEDGCELHIYSADASPGRAASRLMERQACGHLAVFGRADAQLPEGADYVCFAEPGRADAAVRRLEHLYYAGKKHRAREMERHGDT